MGGVGQSGTTRRGLEEEVYDPNWSMLACVRARARMHVRACVCGTGWSITGAAAVTDSRQCLCVTKDTEQLEKL